MSASVQETVSGIIAAFERGDIPEAIAYSMFPILERVQVSLDDTELQVSANPKSGELILGMRRLVLPSWKRIKRGILRG